MTSEAIRGKTLNIPAKLIQLWLTIRYWTMPHEPGYDFKLNHKRCFAE